MLDLIQKINELPNLVCFETLAIFIVYLNELAIT